MRYSAEMTIRSGDGEERVCHIEGDVIETAPLSYCVGNLSCFLLNDWSEIMLTMEETIEAGKILASLAKMDAEMDLPKDTKEYVS